jgi:hypothetical protein
MDYGNIFQRLWEIAIELTKSISSLWNWLNEPLEISFFGIDIVNVAPMAMLGSGLIITLLTFVFIKTFVPGA